MVRSHSSSRSSTSCFSRFDTNSYAQYAATVVFLAVYLGILIALCVIRRKTGAGKRLIGVPYMLALFFLFIEQAIDFVSTMLQVCNVSTDMDMYYNWSIASYVFYGLETMLLLYVVIWTLNTMLRKQLGHNPSALKTALIADLVVLGCLLIASVVMYCYVTWLSMDSYMNRRSVRDFDYRAIYIVDLTFWCLYLVSIIAAGALAVLAVSSLHAKRVAGGSLVIWTLLLYLSLFVHSLIYIIQDSNIFSYGLLSATSYVAMSWINSFCHALSYITIIVIAKNSVWRPNKYAGGVHFGHEDVGHNYQQDPIYEGNGPHA